MSESIALLTMNKFLICTIFILLLPYVVFAEDANQDNFPESNLVFIEELDTVENPNDIVSIEALPIESDSTENSDTEPLDLADTQKPTLDSVEKVSFLDRTGDPSQFTLAPEKIFKEGPLYYLVSFSEPVSGFDAMSLQLVNNNCPANPLISSICGVISNVEPLEILEGVDFYIDWIVTVYEIQNAGTFFLNVINHEDGVTDGISDYVIDEAGNYLQPVEFAPHLKAEYNVDTFPLEIDGAPYLDENGILRIPFNKNISSLVFSNPDLAQFSYIYSNSDSELVTPLIPSQADIDGSEFRVTFPGAPKQRVHSLFKYFAQSDLTQIISEAGVKTPSFSIETFTNNTYTVCVDLDNPPKFYPVLGHSVDNFDLNNPIFTATSLAVL